MKEATLKVGMRVKLRHGDEVGTVTKIKKDKDWVWVFWTGKNTSGHFCSLAGGTTCPASNLVPL